MRKPLKLFLSYAHEDVAYKKEMDIYLSELHRRGFLEYWDDHMLLPGMKWDETIQSKISESQVFIFLISQSFLDSDYIRDKELPAAKEKYEQHKDQVRIIPILVDQCEFSRSPLSGFQALPEEGKNLKAIAECEDKEFAYTKIKNALLLTFLELWKGGDTYQVRAFPRRLSDLLTKLNFEESKKTFNDCLAFGYNSFVFLVHGDRDTGHNWFLRVVLRRWFMNVENENFKVIHLSLDRLDAIDLPGICAELVDKNEFTDCGFETIVDDVCQWASNQMVIFRIDGIADIDETDISVIVDNFCQPLLDKVNSSEKVRYKVILFFVKPQWHPASTSFFEFTENLKVNTPVMLPGLKRLQVDHLKDWVADNMAELANLDETVNVLIHPGLRQHTIEEIIRESKGKIEGRSGVAGALGKLYNVEYQKIFDQLPPV